MLGLELLYVRQASTARAAVTACAVPHLTALISRTNCCAHTIPPAGLPMPCQWLCDGLTAARSQRVQDEQNRITSRELKRAAELLTSPGYELTRSIRRSHSTALVHRGGWVV